MGILHSTTRSLASKQENEEEKHLVGRPSKLSILSNLICRIKGLILRVGSILFSLLKPKKAAADPLLPVQDPAQNTLRQPLILETPPISPSSTILETPPISPSSTIFDADELDNDLVLSSDEDKCSPYGNRSDHHIVVSEPQFNWHELIAWATDLEEGNASRNIHFLDEIISSEEEEDEQDEEEEIKSVIVVREERWIKHYSSGHRILLVGEGDFSFSALAIKFIWAPNIIATSLDSREFLEENYSNALRNIEQLRSSGSQVMHGINVSTMAKHHVLGHLKFDRIIYNFPYAGLGVVKNMSRQSQLRRHQRLVITFLENAREMVSEKGEIHISHKTNGFHGEWRVVDLAYGAGLRLIEAVRFNHYDYPGYNTKCGFGGNKHFNCNPSKTYKFGLQ